MAATVSSERFAQIGPVELCYETLGPDDAPPLLLVMGLGSQMIFWDDEFCAMLVDAGYRVIRFDNRDSGRSTIFADSAPPTLRQLVLRDRRASPYRLEDLAADAAGLLGHLGIERAPVVGASMGGMVAQLMAIDHPEVVSSLVSIMSTTGSRRVGNPKPAILLRLLRRPADDRDGYIAEMVATLQAIGSRTYPTDPAQLRSLAERTYDRGYHPAGTARQLAAINSTSNRTRRLAALRIPATVIHGTEDPLIAPSGGRATARALRGSSLLMLAGMGHDLPRPLWPQVVAAIVQTAGHGA
jgi:pimeloyl-ACP methyl ester carboxylesterase